MESKTHWKKLTNPDYIGAYALDPGEERNVKIVKVQREMVAGPDGKKEECTVAHLEGQKPFILNVVNQKTITKVTGSPYIEDWSGKWITVYVAKVRAFGDMVDALRVRDKAPNVAPSKPDLNPSHARWAGAVKAIEAGNTTIDEIKKSFTLSKENEELLCKSSKSVAAPSEK